MTLQDHIKVNCHNANDTTILGLFPSDALRLQIARKRRGYQFFLEHEITYTRTERPLRESVFFTVDSCIMTPSRPDVAIILYFKTELHIHGQKGP